MAAARSWYKPIALEDPDYWDFLYFSTSIGATSQTSGTEIRSRALRGW